MSSTPIPPALRQLVIERAKHRCEYCLMHEGDVLLPHQIDHIIAQQHGGETTDQNLALACIHCNRSKGPNIASVDPLSQQLTLLFNPRSQAWAEHFVLQGAYIQPLTPVGRITVQLLKLNHPDRLQIRQMLLEINAYP